MRLYHNAFSANARRAVMTALHLGSDVELVNVDLARGEQRAPGFLKQNPAGKVPVLEDDGFILTESHAIMQYLADKAGGNTLYPTELRARADVSRWLFWSAHHFTPAVAVLNWERVVKGLLKLGPPDPAEEARGERDVKNLGAHLEQHLEGKKWIAQDRLTLADLAIASPFMTLESARLPLTSYERVIAWLDRVKALDAWKKTEL